MSLVSDTFAVAKRTVSVTLNDLADKVYNSRVDDAVFNGGVVSNVVAGETLNVVALGNGVYNDKDVLDASYATFTVQLTAGNNTDLNNYQLDAGDLNAFERTANGKITPATLSVSIDGSLFVKVYDTTVDTEEADRNYTTDAFAGDDIAVSGDFSYDNPHAGTDKTVTFSDLVLSGADKDNYLLASTEVSDGGAVIEQATVYVTVNDQADVVYGTEITPSYTVSGLLNDGSSVSGELFISGEKSSSGNYIVGEHRIEQGTVAVDSTDYRLEFTGDTFAVSAKKLAVSIDGSQFVKVYDGTVETEESDRNYATDALAEDQVVVNGIYQYDNKNAGTGKEITFSDLSLSGADSSNYELVSDVVTGSDAEITPRTLELTVIVPTTKEYDGTTDVSSQVIINNGVEGDDVVIQTEWIYNSPDVLEADTITNIGWNIAGEDSGNYQLPDDLPYPQLAGEIIPREVDVTFDTDAPYYYNGTDQSGTVFAGYVNVDGEYVGLTLDWGGKSFINVGTYTVTALGNDPNYALQGATIVLEMQSSGYVPGVGGGFDYSEGLYPGFSAVIPSMQGDFLAGGGISGGAYGNIYSMSYAELISHSLRQTDNRFYPVHVVMDRVETGLQSGLSAGETTVSVDALKYCPFELDIPVKEISGSVTGDSNVTNVQGLYLGQELFIDDTYYSADSYRLLNSVPTDHEPLYIEQGYEASDTLSYNVTGQELLVPAALFEQNTDNRMEYDIPAVAVHVTEKQNNLKSDLEKLLDEMMAFV